MKILNAFNKPGFILWKTFLVSLFVYGSSFVMYQFLTPGIARSQITTVTNRVSVDAAGVQGNEVSTKNSIDEDGSHVAFTSLASNLVSGDTNGYRDIFVYETATGEVERVSVTNGGVQGNSASDSPAISADGRYVAFQSEATNLVTGDTNARVDVFVYDRTLDTIERVSVDSSEAQANGHSYYPSISEDGQYVVFQSSASDLVASDTNNAVDVFLRDRTAGTTERVSIDTLSGDADGHSIYPDVSDDGRYVVFSSIATDLIASDTNSVSDVFVRDRTAATTARASVDSAGTESDGLSSQPSISGDGRYVVFESEATNLVASDTNLVRDIFVRDLQQNSTQRVSVASGGTELNNISGDSVDNPNGRISSNGQFVVFKSHATNAVSDDANGLVDVFVHDRQSLITTRVSVSSLNAEANHVSYYPSISGDGRYIGYYSYADNLVDNDTNEVGDVFVYDRDSAAPTATPTPTLTPTPTIDWSWLNPYLTPTTTPMPTPTPGPSEVGFAVERPSEGGPVEVDSWTSAGMVTFRCDEVLQSGSVTIRVYSSPPGQLTEEFNILPTNFDITKNNLICNYVTLCLPYQQSELDSQNLSPGDLRMMHWWEENWNDVTTNLDVQTNQVCGQVVDFSPFILGEFTSRGETEMQGITPTPYPLVAGSSSGTSGTSGSSGTLPASGTFGVTVVVLVILVSLMLVGVKLLV